MTGAPTGVWAQLHPCRHLVDPTVAGMLVSGPLDSATPESRPATGRRSNLGWPAAVACLPLLPNLAAASLSSSRASEFGQDDSFRWFSVTQATSHTPQPPAAVATNPNYFHSSSPGDRRALLRPERAS